MPRQTDKTHRQDSTFVFTRLVWYTQRPINYSITLEWLWHTCLVNTNTSYVSYHTLNNLITSKSSDNQIIFLVYNIKPAIICRLPSWRHFPAKLRLLYPLTNQSHFLFTSSCHRWRVKRILTPEKISRRSTDMLEQEC